MHGRRRAGAFLLAVLAAAAAAQPAQAGGYTIDSAQSVFAVLTHKAGIAASLAHDHLVVAVAPAVTLDFDPLHPETTTCTVVVAADTLEVDAPARRAAWKGRLRDLGLQQGDLPPVPESDRKKVRAAMLGESQLGGAQFPEIRAQMLGLERGAATAAAGEGTWNLVLRLTIRERTLERKVPVSWSEEEGTLAAETYAELQFADFGIEPYSTMLGAIRNDERFHLYVKVVARRAP